MSKATKWLLIIVVVAGSWYLWNRYDQQKQCKDMALKASVEEVTPDMYPNAAARNIAQEDYQRRYMESCPK